MKKLIIAVLGIITYCGCNGQRYEVWVNPGHFNDETRGYYGFSNDSVLTVYSKSTLFIPSKDSNISWDNISSLNIRNKSKNDFGVILGTAMGTLATYLLFESEKAGKINLGSEFGSIIPISLGLVGGGALIGHLFTCAKISIPLNGKSAKEKSQTLKNRINKIR